MSANEIRQHVVVTGASRGIGRATASALAERGLALTLVGRPSAQLEEARESFARSGAACRVIHCDLQVAVSVEAAGAEALRWGAPAALVNCAGIVERAPLEELTLESYQRQMAVNLTAPIWLARALLPAMRSAKSGRIVNVGSISATLGSAGQIAYNASKWALVGFTKSLAEELSDSGLMTVVVHPGAVDTDMLRGSPYPPRMTPQDVARTLVFYALEAPLAHNGAVIEMFGV